MLGFAALDLILRRFYARMTSVLFDLELGGMYANDGPADVAGFRIPAYLIADLELSRHFCSSCGLYHAPKA